MDLRLKIEDIPPEGIEVPLNVEAEEARENLRSDNREDSAIVFAEPISGRIHIQPVGGRFVFRGRIETRIQTVCSRCLDEFALPVAGDIFVVFSPCRELDKDRELEAEDLNLEILSGEEIDLWPIVQEHLVLNLPIKPLCEDDCRGLCPICGCNLNSSQCHCRAETGHPGLAALKEIKDKLPL